MQHFTQVLLLRLRVHPLTFTGLEDYQKGAEGSNDCPAGYTTITSASDCGVAARAVGFDYTSAETEEDSTYPRGCYYWVTEYALWHAGGLYFNTHSSGGDEYSSTPLCRRGTIWAARCPQHGRMTVVQFWCTGVLRMCVSGGVARADTHTLLCRCCCDSLVACTRWCVSHITNVVCVCCRGHDCIANKHEPLHTIDSHGRLPPTPRHSRDLRGGSSCFHPSLQSTARWQWSRNTCHERQLQ